MNTTRAPQENLPTCCVHHGFSEGGCNGGRECTAGRVAPEDAYRWLFRFLAALAAIVTLGMCAAFVIENWHALELLITT